MKFLTTAETIILRGTTTEGYRNAAMIRAKAGLPSSSSAMVNVTTVLGRLVASGHVVRRTSAGGGRYEYRRV